MKTVKTRPESSLAAPLLTGLAGNRFTLLSLALLGAGIVVNYRADPPAGDWLVILPTLLLVINFLLALAIRGILKNNWPLMVFHFALLALVALVFAGRLSHFQGTLELAENEFFHGDAAQIDNIRQGPWHRYGLRDTRFANRGFRISYRSGVKRDRTVNRMEKLFEDGQPRIVEIGDHVPLVVGHYRFYTTHNKGYAPVFEWRADEGGRSSVGSIHLPSYPGNEFRQALEWQLPGSGLKLWTQLKIDEQVLPEDRAFEFSVPRRHRLVLRYADRRIEMIPGQSISLPGGELHYRGLTSWMGYKIDYDWTRPWLLATAIIGILALFVHYGAKFSLPGFRRFRSGSGAVALSP